MAEDFRERMQPASFKGVLFYVESSQYTKGRRVPVLKSAGRDGSKQQDLGRDPDEFDVTAFLFGDDFDLLRDELEETLAELGPGPLVLPTRGELWVRITRGPVTSESKDTLGFCSIRFSAVVEDRKAGSLRTRTNTPQRVTESAAAVQAAASADFVASYDAQSLPSRYLDATISTIGTITDTLRSVQRMASSAVGSVSAVTSALTELDNATNAVTSLPSELVTNVVDSINATFAIADTARANIDRLTGLPAVLLGPFDRASSARATLRMAVGLAALEVAPEEGETANAVRARENVNALGRLTRTAAIARAAQTFAVAPFDSSTLAIETLERMREAIDALQHVVSDEVAGTLADLRAALASHLTVTAVNLPEIVTYTPRQPLPALLIAHELYGDARREDDLVARNRMPRPLFCDVPLEVLAP